MTYLETLDEFAFRVLATEEVAFIDAFNGPSNIGEENRGGSPFDSVGQSRPMWALQRSWRQMKGKGSGERQTHREIETETGSVTQTAQEIETGIVAATETERTANVEAQQDI